MKRMNYLKNLMAAMVLLASISMSSTALGAVVTVTSPNGGEILAAGSPATITWTSDATGFLRIALLKNGVQYMLIAGGTANDGTHTWNVPSGILSGDDYMVKISSCLDPLVTDVSDAAFSITGGIGSYITVTAPNGGETYTAGTTAPITWNSDVTGNVRINLLKNGLPYGLIASSTPNDGSHDWLIPAGLMAGSEYTIKITSVTTPLLFDVSDAPFSVTPGGGTTVTVTAPNGGETFTAGTSTTITYTSDITGNVRIVLLKNGVQVRVIAAALPNTGSFNWLIPATVISGTDYTVKVSSCVNPAVTDVSDASFTIVGTGGSFVTVTAPNGGETLTAGTTTTITWNSDITGNVRISLLKGGLQYALISAGTPNDGTFEWALPAGMIPGTEYTVKVASAATPLLYDVSDATFTVIRGGGTTLTLTSPNGGETWVAGTPATITWTSDIIGYFRISLLKGGIEFMLIASKRPNTGNYIWNIPATLPEASDYTVKICYCLDPTLFDISDTSFTITPTPGTSLAPIGDDQYKAGLIGQPEQKPIVNIFPNPAFEYVNITADQLISHVWIMDNLGKTVFESKPESKEILIEVNNLAPGFYFLKSEMNGTVSTQRLVIN